MKTLSLKQEQELRQELARLQHRRTHVVLSQSTREREDARIREIIGQLNGANAEKLKF